MHGKLFAFYPEEVTGRFTGFGGSYLAPDRCLPAQESVVVETPKAVVRHVRQHCPALPGVYGMVDAEGRLIYVGKSKCLRDRLASYFSPSAEAKARRIASQAVRVVWEVAPQEFTALLRELELIRRWCPRFNVRGRPGRVRRGYVAVGRGSAARVFLAARPGQNDRLVIGPLRPTRALRAAIRTLNDAFQLRDCPDRTAIRFASQPTLFDIAGEPRCARYALGTCLGPCAGLCSQRQYAQRVRQACNFLRGADRGVVDRLEQAMRKAAAEQAFERAAVLRDRWRSLGELAEQLDRLHTARKTYSFVYPLPGYDGGTDWYVVYRGHVVAVIEGPHSTKSAERARDVLDRVFRAHRVPDHALAEDPEMIQLVGGWFKAHPEELERVLSPAAAMEEAGRWLAGCLLPGVCPGAAEPR